MASQSNYWTWDSGAGNYYHPEWNARTRTWEYTWAPSSSSTPRSLNPSYPGGAPQPEPQPLEGFGRPVELPTNSPPRSLPPGQRNYLHSAPYGAADSLARSMGQLSTAEPAYHSQSHVPPQRRGSTPQETSQAAENRRAPDFGYSPQNAIEPLPAYEDEVSPGHVPTGKPTFGARLDPKYQVMKRPHEYFLEGTVFSKLHTEEAGSTSADFTTFGFSTVAYDGRVYSQLRRFVVVMPKPKELFCLCVPITTYSGKGTMKKGVDKNAHTIIYTGNQAPRRLPEEKGMNKAPLKVIPVGPEEMLDPMSRINIGKPYSVEWNNKVKPIGRLDHSSRLQLRAYWKELVNTS
ncbi:MAG: hypothetical protein Q9212_004999 [Teloschistes hypoglaucus]